MIFQVLIKNLQKTPKTSWKGHFNVTNAVDQSRDNLEYGLKSTEENTQLLPKESENLLSRYGGME